MFKTFNYEGSTGWKLTNFYSETDKCAPVLPYVAVYNLSDLESQMFNNYFKKKEQFESALKRKENEGNSKL
jgi:hypothetical protein